MSTAVPNRADILAVVTNAVRTVLKRRGITAELHEETVLSGGPASVLDSLGMVMLTVEIEQQLDDHFHGQYRLSPEGLMAAAGSDIETIGSLTDLVLATVEPQ